jgi:hypothetical protein
MRLRIQPDSPSAKTKADHRCSWSKGRNGHGAFDDCQRHNAVVNMSTVKLEGSATGPRRSSNANARLSAAGRELHHSRVWEQSKAEANDCTKLQRRAIAIQQKPDEAFLPSEVIDVTTYGRQCDQLRQELTQTSSTMMPG